MAVSPVGYRLHMFGLTPATATDMSYWPMNETGTTCFDQQTGARDLTYAIGSTTAEQRAIGNQPQYVHRFDGSEYAEASFGLGVLAYTSITAWVYSNGPASARTWIVAAGSGSTYAFALYLQSTTQALEGVFYQSAGAAHSATLSDPQVLVPRRWTHVALTYNSAAPVVSLYRDGQLVAQSTAALSGSIGGTTSLAIGRRPDNANSKWSGYIGHVGYWASSTDTRCCLSATEIHQLYRRGLARTIPQRSRMLRG